MSHAANENRVTCTGIRDGESIFFLRIIFHNARDKDKDGVTLFSRAGNSVSRQRHALETRIVSVAYLYLTFSLSLST